MKIVLLESLSVSKECMKKYTDILEQEGHSFQCYERMMILKYRYRRSGMQISL